jgi:hypothetical protein
MPSESDRKVGGVSAEAHAGSTESGRSTRRKIGGVSAQMRPHGGEGAPAAGPLSLAHGDFVWNGGPVITCPLIYGTFWGSHWTTNPAYLSEAGRLTQFLADIVNSEYMNVLSQYGAGSGKGSGLFMQASFITNVASNISDTDIHNIIQGAINTGAIPEPPANNRSHVIVIYLDESVAVKDSALGVVMCEPAGDNAFGYHYFFNTAKGNFCPYAVIPALDDACLKNSCASDASCSLHLSHTQEQRRTQVTSHEFAEMVTDPQFPTGWFGPTSDENGDICNGETDFITVGPNTWDVQRQYSKNDDIASNGASFCITTAPNPIPKLTPGPSGINAAMAEAQRFGNYRPFLPLPTAFYDAKSKSASWDKKHVDHYMRRFFFPFHTNNIFADFPGTLRQFADILEPNKK